ncbi:MAG: nuclear transport factor 2 family protein [Syntrophales bacterium LBB04]|nr:nuclear transport factor 2 family protein [Syntrophales bacterium LBB04]
MKLTREQIIEAMAKNGLAWDHQDLEGVLELYHDDVYFENWTGGSARGKVALREAWTPWFTSGGGFKFNRDGLFIDEDQQQLTLTWELEWSSTEKGFEGRPEKRRGLDIIQFQAGRIIKKLTYAKTTIEIDGKRIRLTAG